MSNRPSFCPQCGQKLQEEGVFCPRCGFRLEIQPEPEMQPVQEEIIEVPVVQEPEILSPDPLPDPVEQTVECPNCRAHVSAQLNFCTSCGHPLEKGKEAAQEEIFADVLKPEEKPQKKEKKKIGRKNSLREIVFASEAIEEDPVGVFADGMPDWDLLPPGIIRRKRNR